MMDTASTIGALLESGADDAPALSAPDGVPLSYRALRALVADTARTLGARGIGPGDRVAIVLPNGPEMAGAFLGIVGGVGLRVWRWCCPMDPRWRRPSWESALAPPRPHSIRVTARRSSAFT